MTNCDTEDISDLPPSAKLVYKVLEYNGKLTQKQIAEKSLLAPRTVRYALNELKTAGVVESEVNLADARQQFYRLSEPKPRKPDAEDSGTASGCLISFLRLCRRL
jgi:DNA-binding MarR family transcriptional regulator